MPEQVWKGRERVKVKIFIPSFLTQLLIKNLKKKIANIFKNLKNFIMASFQAITGWERLRKSENENYLSDHFLPNS